MTLNFNNSNVSENVNKNSVVTIAPTLQSQHGLPPQIWFRCPDWRCYYPPSHTHHPRGFERFITNMRKLSGESSADFPSCSKKWLVGQNRKRRLALGFYGVWGWERGEVFCASKCLCGLNFQLVVTSFTLALSDMGQTGKKKMDKA